MKSLQALIASALLATSCFAYEPVATRTKETYQRDKQSTASPALVWEFYRRGGLKFIPDIAMTFKDHTGQIRHIGDDYMMHPIDTYLRGGGECEEYAALAVDWLKAHGYRAYIVGVWTVYQNQKTIGHAFCAVKEKDSWSYLGNDAYKTGFMSINDMVKKKFGEQSYYFFFIHNPNNPKGRELF